MSNENTFHPQFGYAIVRQVDAGKTAGGLHTVNLENQNAHFILVEASEGHIVDGIKIPCVLQPGDRVVIAPTRQTLVKAGVTMERHVVITQWVEGMPQDHAIAKLMDITAYQRAPRVVS